MGIFNRKPKSDAEYVEDIRKGLRASKTRAVVMFAVAVLMACLVPWFLNLFFRLIDGTDGELAWTGFALGLVFGAVFYGLVHKAANTMIRAFEFFQGRRGDRLLVEYHDALVKIANDSESRKQNPGGDVGRACAPER